STGRDAVLRALLAGQDRPPAAGVGRSAAVDPGRGGSRALQAARHDRRVGTGGGCGRFAVLCTAWMETWLTEAERNLDFLASVRLTAKRKRTGRSGPMVGADASPPPKVSAGGS